MKAVVLALMGLLSGCGSAPLASTTNHPVQTSSTAEPAPVAIDETPSEQPVEAVAPPPEPEPQLAQEPAEPLPPPPLPEGTTVLHVGSSTAAALGQDLKRELEARGVKCVLRAKDASYIPEWAGLRMGLREMINTHNPDLVIVSLGGNEIAMPDPSVRADPITRIVKLIGDRPCVWVGTPRWKGLPHTGILEVIQQNIAPCRFVDSDELVPNLITLADGIHPTLAERRRWARRMLQWLEHNRDPKGTRPWDFKNDLVIPAAE